MSLISDLFGESVEVATPPPAYYDAGGDDAPVFYGSINCGPEPTEQEASDQAYYDAMGAECGQ